MSEATLITYDVKKCPKTQQQLRRRNRNQMDLYRMSKVDVPESPISSGARGP